MTYGNGKYQKGSEILDPAFEKYQSQIASLQQNKPMSGSIQNPGHNLP